jgi:hypothetical protein
MDRWRSGLDSGASINRGGLPRVQMIYLSDWQSSYSSSKNSREFHLIKSSMVCRPLATLILIGGPLQPSRREREVRVPIAPILDGEAY